ncbi:MAG TPA: GNAT family N-acetyltransferase [Terriglobia bacterium]|nr:GNAT family N-acetyltransferase [Terriglobia bacterium]
MLRLHRLDLEKVPWELLDQFDDRTVFQTRAWLDFIAESQRATPVVAELRDGLDCAGYFTGLVVRRLGIRMLGSSFPGWTTPYIGFNLNPGVSRRECLPALETFAFKELGCLHLEISDRGFDPSDGDGLGFAPDAYHSYQTDLTQPEDIIFNQMNSACRRCIRKAEKSGVRIEEAHDGAFAGEYYEQLKDVFAKQGLVPTYGLDRVESLVRNLLPTGRLLLLRAIDAEGHCVGTGIYPGMNKVAEFWGNASFRHSQHLRPNESLHWHAMRYWKRQGVKSFDWGGGGEYKEKYGVTPIAVPWFRKSRFRFLDTMRREAKRAVELKQRALGRLQASKVGRGRVGAAEDE